MRGGEDAHERFPSHLISRKSKKRGGLAVTEVRLRNIREFVNHLAGSPFIDEREVQNAVSAVRLWIQGINRPKAAPEDVLKDYRRAIEVLLAYWIDETAGPLTSMSARGKFALVKWAKPHPGATCERQTHIGAPRYIHQAAWHIDDNAAMDLDEFRCFATASLTVAAYRKEGMLGVAGLFSNIAVTSTKEEQA